MSTMVIKRGDLWPSLEVTLTGTDEDTGEVGPVDLTGATSVQAVAVQNGVRIIERAVSGSSSGVVTMPWEAGDTDAIGYIRFEFVVTWPNGKEQTFPQGDVVRVRVALDNGSS